MKIFKEELIEKIKLFNNIYVIDAKNNYNSKNWRSYLDPICKYLYKMEYLDFINKFQLNSPSVPGSLEAYYNFFNKCIEDLEGLTSLDIPNQIVKCLLDVKGTFDRFLSLNDYKISKSKQLQNGMEYTWINIFPIV